MKVSKKSWHYRMLAHADLAPYGKVSLCQYVWMVLFLVAVHAIVLGVVGVFIWAVVNQPLILVALGIALGLIAVVSGSVIGTVFLVTWLSKPGPDGSPGLFRSWLKAKKQKVCPLIEFTDGEEKA